MGGIEVTMYAARFWLLASAGLAALENNILRVAKSGTKLTIQMYIRDSDEMVFIQRPGKPGDRDRILSRRKHRIAPEDFGRTLRG
jgi:DNA-binding IclR family transcriptional regulator